jgi:asparagine synthetase B (glutamine-hydrolysing)
MAQLNEKTDEEVFNHTVQPCMISSLILSSVALADFFLQEQQAYHTSYENSDNISITQLEAVQEVIPGRVYQFNLSTKKISHVDILHIPTQHLAHERDASVCSIVDRNIVPEAMNQRDLLKDNPFDHVPSFTNVSDTCEIEQERMPRIPHTLGSLSLSFSTIHIQAAETLLQHLSTAVRRRVINLSSLVSTPSSRVAVLFSGGLDSVILAALSHFHIPIEETIDLINVSFVSTLTDENVETHSSHSVLGHNKIRKDQHNFARDTEEIHQKTDGHDPFESPDRIAAIQSFHELSQLWPQRTYRLLLVNIHYSEVLDYQTRIRALIHPQTSTMDFNIGTAMWFASRGRGVDYNDYKGNESNIHQTQSHITISKAPIVLVGIGADEQMAGYGRHRSVYKRGGYDALRAELSMEKDRLWTRNLGRDDRIIADHGKEARFPYLDEDVVAYLNSLDVADRCDMTKPPGIGDKVILRIAANMLGLRHCTSLVKRAIQFGSRIAHVSDVQKFGSRQRAKGWKPYV